MSQDSNLELAVISPISPTPLAEPSSTGPAPRPSNSKPALRRCCAAWQRVFNEHMEGSDGSTSARYFANKYAGPAYCDAMPPLDGREGIRDFIACTAHGILIGAIPAEQSGQLLYAAQVALNALPREPKSTSA